MTDTGASAQARAIAQDVVGQAALLHQRFAFGFRYIGASNYAFEISARTYAGMLGVMDRVNFQSRSAAALEGADAKYFHLQNGVRFQTARLGASHTRSSLLHEMVHALQDSARFSGAHWEWEATAYMAQALWFAGNFAMRGGTVDQYLAAIAAQPTESGILPLAAERCLAVGAGRSIATVRATDLLAFRSLLRVSPIYGAHADTVETGDGL